MKKTLVIMLVALIGIGAQQAKAQIDFGIVAGMNVNKADFKHVGNNVRSGNRCGWFVGPKAEFTLPLVGIGADASTTRPKDISVTNLAILAEVSSESATNREKQATAETAKLEARKLDNVQLKEMGDVMRAAELTINIDIGMFAKLHDGTLAVLFFYCFESFIQ